MEMLKIFLTLLLQQLCIGVLSKKTSGFYIENEFNQTVLLEFLTPDIELQVKENILRILDIEKPQIQQKMSLIKNSSAHTFLMEVYNLLNDNNVYNLIDLNLQSELFDITIEAVNSYMKESNIIISLISHEAIIPNITKMKTKKFINLWFNLTTISSQDQLINAELKIYRRIRNVLPMYKGPITIKIYRISNLNEGEKKEEIFINSIRVIEAGWITLNITKTLNYWIQNPNENHGLTIKIHSDKQVKEIDPKKFGIVGLEENNQEKSPFMVGYFQRASDNRKKLNLSLLNFQSFDENKIRDKRTISLCRKENLYVDFHDLNWQDWMIIPRGYSANFCSGECQFPIKSEMFATNHAVIQLMVNLNDPSKVPRPCCAPIAFIVFSTRSLTDDQDLFDKESKDTSTNTIDVYANQPKEQIAKNKQTQKHVTPSLAELGGRGTLPEMNDHVLMVTRIPGAGSELLVLILQRLQGYNAFKHIRLPPGDDGILTNLQQELLVEEITSIIKQEAVPLSFDGDVRFLNFSSFDRQAPTFISLVRDPLDPRTLDRFRNGDSSMIYSGSVAHFCGQDIRCTQRNSKWALERAKANAIRWYPVIGILDLMDETLQVLESSFPQFFEGAKLVYKNLRPKNISSEATSLKNTVKKRLGKILAKEVEFYEWLKSRLLKKTSSNG